MSTRGLPADMPSKNIEDDHHGPRSDKRGTDYNGDHITKQRICRDIAQCGEETGMPYERTNMPMKAVIKLRFVSADPLPAIAGIIADQNIRIYLFAVACCGIRMRRLTECGRAGKVQHQY